MLPELRGMSSSSDDEGQTRVRGEFKARSASITRTRSDSATVEGTTTEVAASSLSQLNIRRLPSTFSSPNSTTTKSNPSLTVTPAAFVPDRPVLARSGSSPAPGVDETPSQQGPVVFPSGPAPTVGASTDDSAPTTTTTSGREPTVPAAAQPPLEALRAQEAVTLDLLGQRVERDAQGDLVLGRRVSKRTVGSQTTVSAVRNLLEGARERTTTVKSTRSADGSTNTAPSTPPSVRTKAGLQSTSMSRDDNGGGGPRRRFVSDAPTDASFVGGESDDDHGGGVDNGSSSNNNKDEDRSSGSVHTAGTFGLRPPPPSGSVPASPRSTTTTSVGGGGPTPPPLMSSESRGSVSSNASGSSWSVPTPSVPSLPTSATFGSLAPSHGTTPTGGGGLHKPGSRSRLRPSTAPDRSISAETRERELLEGRLRALEEQLARETREKKEVEKRFKRLQVSSREGKARWEDMAGWAVEVRVLVLSFPFTPPSPPPLADGGRMDRSSSRPTRIDTCSDSRTPGCRRNCSCTERSTAVRRRLPCPRTSTCLPQPTTKDGPGLMSLLRLSSLAHKHAPLQHLSRRPLLFETRHQTRSALPSSIFHSRI